MNKLDEIITAKRKEIEKLKEIEESEENKIKLRPAFGKALIGSNLGVVCEVKRKSPSAGNINDHADPVKIAELYEASGASAISVLTDAHFFGGSFEFLENIDQKIKIPLLCKDFILDKIQIRLAAKSGTSAILLITECLTDSQLQDLYEYTRFLGLDALVEAHEPDNIRRAVDLGASIIGINNRNLKTFEIDINWGFKQVKLIPSDRIRMSLSAYSCREEAKQAAREGFDAILIGSTLMKAFNTRSAVHQFTDIPIPNKKRNLEVENKLNFYDRL